MSGTYEPGTVAMVSAVGTDPEVRLLQHPRSGGGEGKWMGAKGFVYDDESVTDVRPLVTIEWAHPRILANSLRDLRADVDPGATGYAVLGELLRQIEAQIKPPKPAEPEKYGAVIAGDGREWFRWTTSERDGFDWCRPGTAGGTKYARWDDLVVARVTNEGVKAGE